MAHVLIAELFACKDGRVRVQVGEDTHLFDELHPAEEFCFALGASSVASMKGKKGYLRATRYEEDTPIAQQTVIAGYTSDLEPLERGVARIGRTGTKLHPAVRYARSRFIQCTCGCPGTSNNHARVSGFWVGIEPTCRR